MIGRRIDAASNVVGTVLLAAITVIIAALIGQFVFGISLTDQDAQAGVSVTQAVNSNGETVIHIELVSLSKADYVAVRTAGGLSYFTALFHPEFDDGLGYRESNGGVQWAEEENDGRNKRYIEAPPNNGSVNVTVEFAGLSYEGSGAAFYAVDANGDQHPIVCDAEGGDGSAPADNLAITFTCDDLGNFEWQDTYGVTASSEITHVYMVTDLENVVDDDRCSDYDEGVCWYDIAEFKGLTVTNESGGTNSICPSCIGVITSNDNWNHDDDNRYGPGNDADEVGEIITVSGVREGQAITIVGGLNGKETVLTTYEVE